jgi:hypothetical protein
VNNKKKYIILGFAILAIIGVLYLVNWVAKDSPPKKENKKVAKKEEVITVKEEFEPIPQKGINPTGTHLLYKLLEKYENTTSIQRIQTSYYSILEDKLPLKNENKAPNIYISVGETFNLDTEDNDYLFDFVYEGNHAFIAFESLHNNFIDYLLPNSETPFYIEGDTTINVNFFHSKFKQDSGLVIQNSSLNYHRLPKYKNWLIINEEALSNDAIEIEYLGDKSTVCVKITYGKGSFIFHSLPDAFSNSFIVKKEGKKHAEIIFSHIPKGNYYWHENFGKHSTYRGESNPDQLQKPKEFSRSSPLQYILKVPALTIALVLSMIGLFLYMVIKSKRKQRIIPPIESDKNSSLEFIEVIAKLYQQQNRHDKIINHIYQNFIAFIKQHYYIQFGEANEKVREKIQLKSGVDIELINQIFNDLENNKNIKVSDAQLIGIYQNIELFHQKCK